MNRLLHKELTDGILKTFYDVYNRLGFGFMERVYENALVYELRDRNYHVVQQKPITVWYGETPVGEFFADMVVNEKVILELKSVDRVISQHEAQLLNYLKATHIEVGLILNFGPEPSFRRGVYELVRREPSRNSPLNNPRPSE
jgi:GxxExxY protein